MMANMLLVFIVISVDFLEAIMNASDYKPLVDRPTEYLCFANNEFKKN